MTTYRCYNGAWDSQAQALFAEQDKLMKAILQREPEAHCTYFPHPPSSYVVHVWGREIGPHRETKTSALEAALAALTP